MGFLPQRSTVLLASSALPLGSTPNPKGTVTGGKTACGLSIFVSAIRIEQGATLTASLRHASLARTWAAYTLKCDVLSPRNFRRAFSTWWLDEATPRTM